MGLYGTAKNELSGAVGKLFNNRYVAWGMIIGCGYLAIRFVNGGLKGMGKIGTAVSGVISKQQILSKNPGTTNTDYNAANLVAVDVAKALGVHPDYQTWSENEAAAAAAMNRVTSKEMLSLVIQIYRNLTGRDLIADLLEFMMWYEYDDIRVTVRQWILEIRGN